MTTPSTPPSSQSPFRTLQRVFFAVVGFVGIYAWGLALHQFDHHHPLDGFKWVGVAILLYGGALGWVARRNIKQYGSARGPRKK